MGSLYRSQHEFVFVFKHGRDGHRNNIQLGQFGRNRSNVWRYPGANTFACCGEEGNLLALHPTVKPVAMVADAILDCSARGDIVLDAFLGSGTTVIAAERTGRRCFGLELDAGYVDTIVRRWQALTGAAPGMPLTAAALMTSHARRRPPMLRDKPRDYNVGYGKRLIAVLRRASRVTREAGRAAQRTYPLWCEKRWMRLSSSPKRAGAAKSPSAKQWSHSLSTARPKPICAPSRSSSTCFATSKVRPSRPLPEQQNLSRRMRR